MGCGPPASSANARISRATFVRDVNDANRPYPVPWRPVHSRRLAVASIAHPLLRDNHTLPIGRFEASRQAAIEKAVYQQSQSHGSAAYSRVVRYLALDNRRGPLPAITAHAPSAVDPCQTGAAVTTARTGGSRLRSRQASRACCWRRRSDGNSPMRAPPATRDGPRPLGQPQTAPKSRVRAPERSASYVASEATKAVGAADTGVIPGTHFNRMGAATLIISLIGAFLIGRILRARWWR
jgi:hypothetical protein